jgi:hypothetical protein
LYSDKFHQFLGKIDLNKNMPIFPGVKHAAWLMANNVGNGVGQVFPKTTRIALGDTEIQCKQDDAALLLY